MYIDICFVFLTAKTACTKRLVKFNDAAQTSNDSDDNLSQILIDMGNVEMDLLKKSGSRGAAGKLHEALGEVYSVTVPFIIQSTIKRTWMDYDSQLAEFK